jgi:ferredoxin
VGQLIIEPGIYSGEIAPTKSILLVMLESGAYINYSCRRGLCGQDLIQIKSGWEFLNPIGELEEGTLEMLGVKGQPYRMACSARVVGEGTVVVEKM